MLDGASDVTHGGCRRRLMLAGPGDIALVAASEIRCLLGACEVCCLLGLVTSLMAAAGEARCLLGLASSLMEIGGEV